jgi:hypothetical protein
VDLGANQRRGVVVAHLPAGALAEGRLPGCYPLLSFRAALLHGEGEGGLMGAAAGQFSEGGEDSPLLSSSHSHSRRQSVTAQSVCDDREREVIGLASGLGVTGTRLPYSSSPSCACADRTCVSCVVGRVVSCHVRNCVTRSPARVHAAGVLRHRGVPAVPPPQHSRRYALVRCDGAW